MINIIIRFITQLSIFKVVRAFQFKVRDTKPTINKVRASELYGLLGFVGILFMGGFLVASIRSHEDWWVVLGFLIFVFMGIYLVLYGLFWKIDYDDNSFTYRNIFALKSTYPYSSITRIKRTKNAVYFYVNNKKFTLEKYAVGYGDFISVLAKRSMRIKK